MRLNCAYHTFTCPSGGYMRWAEITTESACGTVFIMPGWAEWLEKYQEIIIEWCRRGFSVVIIEWQGQGLSYRFLLDRNKAWVPSFDILVDDVAAFYKTHVANKDAVHVFAHSMGAHLALRWRREKERQDNVQGFILSSILHETNRNPIPLPLARVITGALVLAGLGRSFVPGQRKHDQAEVPFERALTTRDAVRYWNNVQQLRERPELKTGGVTYGWLDALFRSTAKLERELRQVPVTDACLILASSHDRVVAPRGVRTIADLLPEAEVHFFENAGHEVFQEVDQVRRDAWERVAKFLQRYHVGSNTR